MPDRHQVVAKDEDQLPGRLAYAERLPTREHLQRRRRRREPALALAHRHAAASPRQPTRVASATTKAEPPGRTSSRLCALLLSISSPPGRHSAGWVLRRRLCGSLGGRSRAGGIVGRFGSRAAGSRLRRRPRRDQLYDHILELSVTILGFRGEFGAERVRRSGPEPPRAEGRVLCWSGRSSGWGRSSGRRDRCMARWVG